jgi:hypothetical protein
MTSLTSPPSEFCGFFCFSTSRDAEEPFSKLGDEDAGPEEPTSESLAEV